MGARPSQYTEQFRKDAVPFYYADGALDPVTTPKDSPSSGEAAAARR
ncbi:hypothetical protein GCM10011608_54500 [Micromonospora sonchi]|uniref:Uncharacterized protein n=1 Tax=Micromonospora sonchi TaxID=1763543 RepID=A0A917U6U5_9ACTN|nr:hypothetical protein [Micromonospora sonchi]GGM62444.1 hypothetical protein GCM10011608_54500 [Micromonospora sonchi]